VLGRIALPTPSSQVTRVSYYYGAPGDVGGGVYVRPPADESVGGSSPPFVMKVPGGTTIDNALINTAVAQWTAPIPARVVIEITDSRTCTLSSALTIQDNVHLEIRAERSGPSRPLLAVSSPTTPVTVTLLGKGSQLTFEGVWIAAALRVSGQDSSRLTFAH